MLYRSLSFLFKIGNDDVKYYINLQAKHRKNIVLGTVKIEFYDNLACKKLTDSSNVIVNIHFVFHFSFYTINIFF